MYDMTVVTGHMAVVKLLQVPIGHMRSTSADGVLCTSSHLGLFFSSRVDSVNLTRMCLAFVDPYTTSQPTGSIPEGLREFLVRSAYHAGRHQTEHRWYMCEHVS
jgi:hypothetical protein